MPVLDSGPQLSQKCLKESQHVFADDRCLSGVLDYFINCVWVLLQIQRGINIIKSQIQSKELAFDLVLGAQSLGDVQDDVYLLLVAEGEQFPHDGLASA